MARLDVFLVNDNPEPLNAFELVLRFLFEDVAVRRCLDPGHAHGEISARVPDLLITSDRMPGLSGEDLVKDLLTRTKNCAVIITSAWEPTCIWVQELQDQGARVAYLPMPWTMEDVQQALATVGIRVRRQI